MTKDEQIRYLKQSILKLRYEMKIQKLSFILMICAFIGFLVGVIFMILKYYLIGIISILLTIISIMYIYYLMFKKLYELLDCDIDEKKDHLEKILNIK